MGEVGHVVGILAQAGAIIPVSDRPGVSAHDLDGRKVLVLERSLCEALIAARAHKAGSGGKKMPTMSVEDKNEIGGCPAPPCHECEDMPDTPVDVEKAASLVFTRLDAMMRAGQGEWLVGKVQTVDNALMVDAAALERAALASGVDVCVLRAIATYGSPVSNIRLRDGQLFLNRQEENRP